MEQKVQKLLRKKLAHLDDAEQDTAARYLILAGLKHYSLLYAGQDVHIPILEFLGAKYVEELSKPPPAGRIHESKKEPIPSAHVSVNLGNRQFRLDSMAHYPFADTDGTVTEVLHTPTTDLQTLLDMGAPARKRLIIKVFEEMRFSKVGMRMSDVPEALDRLGLRVSTALRKILERTDPAHLHKQTPSMPVPTAPYVENHITLVQLSFIVKRLIHLIRQGIHPEDIIHLFDSDPQFLAATSDNEDSQDEWQGEHKHAGDHGKHEYDQDTGYQEGSGDEHQQILQQARNTRMSQRRHKNHQNNNNKRAVSEQEQFLHSLKHVSSKIAPVIAYDKKRYQQVTGKQNKAALRTVAQRRVDALTSTAVPLGFKDRHYFSEPRLFHSKMTAKSGELASDVLLGRDSSAGGGGSRQSGYKDFKRFADLSSGQATMEIADAFLQGDIGREILSTTESDHRSYPDDELLDPASAQRTASSLLGIHNSRLQVNMHSDGSGGSGGGGGSRQYSADATFSSTYPHRTSTVSAGAHSHYSGGAGGARVAGMSSITGNRLSSSAGTGRAGAAGDMHVSRYATAQSEFQLRQYGAGSKVDPQQYQPPQSRTPLEYGHRSVQQKRSEAALNDTAKRMYEAPGWRSAQGGWVADFGPPHTHALYTGPEVNNIVLDGTGTAVPVKPWQQQRTERQSSGVAEQRMSQALHSMAAETSQLQAQVRSNDAHIDDMLLRTHRDISTVTKAAGVGSARNTPLSRTHSPDKRTQQSQLSANAFTDDCDNDHHSAHHDEHEHDELHDKFSSHALQQQQQHNNNHRDDLHLDLRSDGQPDGDGQGVWDDGSYSVDTAVAGAGAGAGGFLPEDPRGAAAHRQYAEQYSEQSSSDDGYLNMDDSISLSAAIAATSK